MADIGNALNKNYCALCYKKNGEVNLYYQKVFKFDAEKSVQNNIVNDM